MTNPTILNFLKEIINRIGSKSPWFFVVFQIIAGAFVIAGKVPWALERWTTIEASQQFINFCNDISKGALGFLTGLLLTAKSKAVGQTDEGKAVMVTNENKFPFSAKVEAKDVIKSEPPPMVLPEVPEKPPPEPEKKD